MSLQYVADAFWTSVQDPEIADVLFGHARWLNRNETNTGPSDPVAANHYKGDLSRVVAIVRSRNIDPEILRKFAKDTRVSVRQELLENPNTPRDVLVELMVCGSSNATTATSSRASNVSRKRLTCTSTTLVWGS